MEFASNARDITVVTQGADVLVAKKFLWKIRNFEILRCRSELVNAQCFQFETDEMGNIPKITWKVSLSVQGSQYTSMNVSCLRTSPTTLNQTRFEVLAQLQTKIYDEDKNNCGEEKSNLCCITETSGNSLQFPLNLKWGNVPETKSSTHPLHRDGSLVLCVALRLFQTKPFQFEQPLSQNSALTEPAFQNNLIADLETALTRADGNHDVNIISKDGKTFKAHRAILGARSPVFFAMFSSGMKEDKSGSVKVDDVSSASMKFMLHFIYTGKLLPYSLMPTEEQKTVKAENERAAKAEGSKDQVTENYDIPSVEELLYVANKYELRELINHFDDNLGIECDSENALYFLELAGKYSLAKVVTRIKGIVKANPFLMTDCFEQFVKALVDG